jgi:hypothetical protein
LKKETCTGMYCSSISMYSYCTNSPRGYYVSAKV